MASATLNYGFPYPVNSDNVDVSGDIKDLAESLDLKVLSIDSNITTLQNTTAYANELSASVSNIFNGNKEYALENTDLVVNPNTNGTFTIIVPTENETGQFTVADTSASTILDPRSISVFSKTNSTTLNIDGDNPYINFRSYGSLAPDINSSVFNSSSAPYVTNNVLTINGALFTANGLPNYDGYILGSLRIAPITDNPSGAISELYGGRIDFYTKRKGNTNGSIPLSLSHNSASVNANMLISGSASFGSIVVAPSMNITGNISISGSASFGSKINASSITLTGSASAGGTIYSNAIETLDYAIFGKNISYPNAIAGYTTTPTSAGSLVLSASSNYQQFLTGSAAHTVVLPVASTLNLGQSYYINNNSTGIVIVNSSGGNLVASMPANTTAVFTCILTSGTTAASWDADFSGATTVTGTGSIVLSASPTLVAPILGTPQSATLTNATGLPVATGISGLGTGIATFLATPTSANLAAAVTGETGTGSVVFSADPTLTGTPLAPTAAVDTSTTQIATTAFVINQNYLKNSSASSTYLTQINASTIYLTQVSASSAYLTQANASATYLTRSSASTTYALVENFQVIEIAKDGTAITGSSQYTFRAPFAMTLTQIPRALLSVASSSGSVSLDITAAGSSIFTTQLSIDESEKTSVTAATPAVLGTTNISNDSEIIFDVVSAGTGAEGLKVIMYYKRT